MQFLRLAITIFLGCTISSISYAKQQFTTEVIDAFKKGSPKLDFRLRFEDAKQQNLKDANATTLRSTVGYETAEFSNSTVKVELVDVANFFGRHYNPGVPELAKPQYTLINDPRGAGLTEGKFTYNGIAQNSFVIGRQYIQLDNERFIGKNDLRQYPQSFDAISINNNMINQLDIFVAYLTYVNTNVANGRAGGRDSLSTWLVNMDWSGYKYGNIAGYVYFNKDYTVTTNSNTTYGVRITTPFEIKDRDDYSYSVELARQQAHFGNPQKYTAYYCDLKISKTIDWFTGIAGVERLSGSGDGPNRAFITPLGSVDSFNGLAQVFATTPAQGLIDTYITLKATAADLTAGIIYHNFRLSNGPGPKYAGQEVDFSLVYKLNAQVDFSFVYAKYNQKHNIAPSTRRLWAMLTANLI